jgi:hypothetical protein
MRLAEKLGWKGLSDVMQNNPTRKHLRLHILRTVKRIKALLK